MCGIVGFTGNRQAAPILLDGLSKLEYRGYDSAGLAVRDGENLAQVVKAKGRPVSYTHLDVYKRQTLYTVSSISLLVWSAINSSFIPDVYKRQDMDCISFR